jgi:hypothetical protein
MENNLTPAENSASQGLHQLRNLVHAIGIACFIIAGTLSIFIYRQTILIRRENAELSAYVNDYQQGNTQQVIENLRDKLAGYAKEHSDFAPIYLRYFGTNHPAAGGISGPVPIPVSSNSPASNVPAIK